MVSFAVTFLDADFYLDEAFEAEIQQKLVNKLTTTCALDTWKFFGPVAKLTKSSSVGKLVARRL